MVIIEKYVLSKMCYIDDIKDNILKLCRVKDLDLKYLKDEALSGSAFDFIDAVIFRSKKTNKHFMYKQILLTTKTGRIYHIAWNFKKDFPVFILGEMKPNILDKYLDEDFCLPDDNIPDNIVSLLHDFKEQYLVDEKIKLK